VQHHAADELDVVVPHVEHALAAFAAHGEGLDQHVVELGAPVESPTESAQRPPVRRSSLFPGEFEVFSP
jgi:hypothetical protein